MDNITNETLLTPVDAVRIVFDSKISYRELLKLSRDGQVPCMKLGNRYFYQVGALRNWMNMNLSTPAWAKIKV